MDAMNTTSVSNSDFDGFDSASTQSAPESNQEPVDGSQDKLPNYVLEGKVSTQKLHHRNMILEGITTHCAHCGHQLTDAVSVNRGIGPTCCKKGYLEEPVNGDEMQALIDLAEFPELVKFLTEHYKPLGLRGLVNGLVRVASLNRPRGRDQKEGNAALFSACCDAIDSLGHAKLSALLRESIVVVNISNSESYPGCVEIHVKYRDYSRNWGFDMRRVYGCRFDKAKKALIVPVHKPGDEKLLAWTDVQGKRVTNRQMIWDLLVRHYGGLVARTPKGVFKIKVLD